MMGGKNGLIVVLLIISLVLSGCSADNPFYYGCPTAPDGYSEHVKPEWIESPAITNVNDINNSTFEDLPNDTQQWLEKYSVSIGFTVTHYENLTPTQQKAFRELRNNSTVTADEEKNRQYSSLTPYFDTYENGYILYEGRLYECETSWQGT